MRSAGPDDIGALVGFNTSMALETEDHALAPDVLQAGIRAVLADGARGFYLVAEVAGEVAGALMVTPEWSDWRAGWFWWIQSVYVLPEQRRRGVYRALYAEVQARGQAAGDVRGIRLYVERENDPAQETYRALGMSHSRYDLFEVDL